MEYNFNLSEHSAPVEFRASIKSSPYFDKLEVGTKVVLPMEKDNPMINAWFADANDVYVMSASVKKEVKAYATEVEIEKVSETVCRLNVTFVKY